MPRSFDAEATPAAPGTPAGQTLVRFAAVMVCGVGLAVATLTLMRAGQELREGGKEASANHAAREPMQPDLALMPRQPRPTSPVAASRSATAARPAPAPGVAPSAPVAMAPQNGPRPTETGPAAASVAAAPPPLSPGSTAVAGFPPSTGSALLPGTGSDLVTTVPRPSDPRPVDAPSTASASAPPVPTAAAETPPPPAAPVAQQIAAPAPPPAAFPADRLMTRREPSQASAALPERRTRDGVARPAQRDTPAQFRSVAAPSGSGRGVRAYDFVADGGRTDAAGIRHLVIRLP